MQFSSLYTTTTTKAQPWKVPNFLCRNKREKQKRVKKGSLALCVMNVSPIYPIFLKAADAFNFHGTYIVLYSLKKCCCLSFTTQVDKMQNIIYVCKFYRYFYQLHYYLHFPQRNISESSKQHSGGLYKLFAPSNSPL